CANADVVSAAIAAVAKKVVFKKVALENLVMVILPAEIASQFLEQITNAFIPSIRRESPLRFACDFVISRFAHRDYVQISVYNNFDCQKREGMIRMNHVMKFGLGVALSFMTRGQGA